MCTISDNLKLCSCGTKDVTQLKNYWILYRGDGDTSSLVGEMMMPADIGKERHKYNVSTLKILLNKGDCFDIVDSFKEGNIIEMYFSCKNPGGEGSFYNPNGDYLTYKFVYKKGTWKNIKFEPWERENNIVQSGKILHGLKTKPKATNER